MGCVPKNLPNTKKASNDYAFSGNATYLFEVNSVSFLNAASLMKKKRVVLRCLLGFGAFAPTIFASTTVLAQVIPVLTPTLLTPTLLKPTSLKPTYLRCEFKQDGCSPFGGGGNEHWTEGPIVPDPDANASEAAKYQNCEDCDPEPVPEQDDSPAEPTPNQGSGSPNTSPTTSSPPKDDLPSSYCMKKPYLPQC